MAAGGGVYIQISQGGKFGAAGTLHVAMALLMGEDCQRAVALLLLLPIDS